jgi:hypothetical protein
MSAEHQTPAPVLDLRQRLESARRAEHNGAEPVSPELVLVDPELAARARARLPDGAERHRAASAAAATRPVQRRRTSRTMRTFRIAAAVVIAGTLVSPGVMLLAGDDPSPSTSSPTANGPQLPVRGEIRPPLPRTATARPTPPRTQTRAARAKRQRPARAKRQRPAATRPAAKPSPGVARTFVWVPVDGADAYEVQFFRGTRRVLLTRTPRPRLVVLPRRASGAGRRFFLAPGAYRWYVWPLFRTSSGLRRGDAIVQAKLVVPR